MNPHSKSPRTKREPKTERSKKREWHGTHHSWNFSPQAFRWNGELIAGVNILPLAGEMRAWMQQAGYLPLMPASEPHASGKFTNPYTASGVTLRLLMSRIINSSHEYATAATPDHDKVDAEIERVRQYNEILIYSARLCEATIKQLLFCTQIAYSG